MHIACVLKLSLLNFSVRESKETLDLLIDDDFVEFSQSGKIWHKADVLDSLPHEGPRHYTTEDIKGTEVSEGVMLVTYRVIVEGKSSLRSSLWKVGPQGWKMIFHQGTSC